MDCFPIKSRLPEFGRRQLPPHLRYTTRTRELSLYDADGDLRIHLDGASGEVKLLGADCAEDFQVRDAATIEPGTVLVIDEAGGFRRSRTAYDRRAAGGASGAGRPRPGLVLAP